MKMKSIISRQLILFAFIIVLFAGLAVAIFGQEDTLQGAWFDDDHFIKLTFYNGSYEVEIRGRLNNRGVYIIAENVITRRRMYTHSNSLGENGNGRWLSQEEAIAEFGNRVDDWFEPFTQTFFISGDILTLVSDFSEQRFIRIQE